MTSITTLIDALRDKATSNTALMDRFGLKKADFTSAYDPRVEGDPIVALEREIAFAFTIKGQDLQIGSYDGVMYVIVTMQDAAESRDLGLALSQTLNQFTLSNPALKLWACWYVGGPVMAVPNKERTAWDTTLVFTIRAK